MRAGVLRKLARNPLSILGALILLAAVVVAIGAPYLATSDPVKLAIPDRLQAPSSEHWFGTDHYGRDVYSRVVYGARISLRVASLACVLAALTGGLIGLLAGLAGGRVEAWLMRITDVFLAFPSLLLAIGISAALGQGETSIILALWLVYTPRFARLTRAVVLEIRQRDFIAAAEAAGARPGRLALRHVVPNVLSPIIVQVSVYFSEMLLSEAALSFLGLGTPPPAPTWGNILSDGRDFMRIAPWISIFPGLTIFVTVLGINLLGDGLRDALDPRSQR